MSAYQLLCDLAACLCAELTPTGQPGPGLCFCGVIPGDIADAGMAGIGGGCEDGCGMAWVRLEAAYPAETAGNVAAQQNNCGTFLGLDIEIGVLRCVETPDDGGESPTPQALEAAVAKQIADMEAMRRAVKCCEALKNIDYLLSTYAPFGPQGFVAGGVWTVSVTI